MKSKNYTIPSQYEAVTELCAEVNSFCKASSIPKENCREIEICLVEALNNIIKHAYKEDKTKGIEIRISYNEDTIEIELRDEGIPRSEFRKPKLEFDPDDIENLPEGGMGLFIIDQLMDEVSYRTENGVNIFTLKKKLS